MTNQFIKLLQRLIPTITTKKGQDRMSDTLVFEVLEGTINPIELAIGLRAIKAICESVYKNEEFIEAFESELASYGRETPTLFGVELFVRNSSTRYDYSDTKEWVSINSEFEALKERKALLEEALRLLKHQNELEYQKGVSQSKDAESCYYIDTETGEEIKLSSPAKAVKGTCIVLKFPIDKTLKKLD